MLKRRLTREFPQLVFHIPTKLNICKLVFAETLSTGTLVDMLPSPSGAETTQSSESQEDSETEKLTTKWQTTQEDGRTLYTAALILKRHLSDTPGMSCPWLPTSENLNVTEAQTVVPLALYNLVNWIIGAPEEPTLDNFVNIADDLHLKVLSVCQDIVYLASKGRKQTPKSLTLGLTVRHLTGSSRLVSLLNKLGHCASWDTVLSLDTSLAQLTLVEGGDKIPKGFSKRAPTTLVWDNIDFGEETIRSWNYSPYQWNHAPEFCHRAYVHSNQTATKEGSFLIQSPPQNAYSTVPSVQKAWARELASPTVNSIMQNAHRPCFKS